MHTGGATTTDTPPILTIHECDRRKEGSSSGHASCESLSSVPSFESLAKLYESGSSGLTEADRVAHEARLVRSLCRLLTSSPAATSVQCWLRVIGLSSDDARAVSLYTKDLLSFITADVKDLISICERTRLSPDARKRLLASTENVRKYLEHWQGVQSSESTINTFTDKQLAWTVTSPTAKERWASRQCSSHASLGSPASGRGPDSSCSTPGAMTRAGFLDSPSTGSPMVELPHTPSSIPSRVSESASSSTAELSVSGGRLGGTRIHTLSPPSPLSAQSTPSLAVHQRTVSHSTSIQFGTPKSPKTGNTQRLIHHAIPHVWQRRNTFRISDNPCSFCRRPLGFGFLNSWEKCKSCKLKVHTHCKGRVGDSCGLTAEHLRAVFDELIQTNNENWWKGPSTALPLPGSRSLHSESAFQYPDPNAIGDSSSSTNSSAPSTPAFPNIGSVNSPYLSALPVRSVERKFTFPDSVPEVPDIVLAEPTDDHPSTSSGAMIGSEDSQSTVRDSLRVQDGSEGTLGIDSQGSQVDPSSSSELSPSGSGKLGGHQWDRNKWNMSTIRGQSGQSSWSDVTIPLQNIEFKKHALVGKGRFGEVMRAYYFGDVAVKFLNMDHVDEDRRLDEFKKEVASFKNVRHDNIVLFLGYCLDQHSLGIVTGWCKGKALHTLLHESTDRIELPTAVQYALQICQGMSYLHTKKIVHRDLRSKNIFIESKNKVVITDLGLFNMERLRYPSRSRTMVVPQYWLSYLSPELIRNLRNDWSELPFTELSDVYSFGTIWFEMLTCDLPWQKIHPDEVVWRVGSGMKAPLIHHLNTTREVKEILLRCWSFSSEDRPSFTDVHSLLGSLPKKRLDRSPSFPALRSYESMF